MSKPSAEFQPLRVAVLTVSDSRSAADDTSGDYLVEALTGAGHALAARALLPDDKYQLRARVSAWIADAAVDGILITGGTGFTGRDSTPETLLISALHGNGSTPPFRVRVRIGKPIAAEGDPVEVLLALRSAIAELMQGIPELRT